MALSPVFSRTYNLLFPFGDFLWILQKEEYELGRYLHWLRRFFFRRNFVVSEKIDWTHRARLTGAVAVVLWVISLVAASLPFVESWLLVPLVVASLFFIPIFVGVAAAVLAPLFSFMHARVRARAAACVARHIPMRIIGIAGSFGKTTTKHFLYDLVRYTYRTQMIPGTINTPSGIAAWLLKELEPATELLIVEMDAYERGEIAQSVRMTPPDIAIITNVGDQHLERFGTQEELAQALSEVAEGHADATVVADAETVTRVAPYLRTKNREVVDTGKLTYRGTALAAMELSKSNQENLARVLRVAELLAIPTSFVEDAISHLELPARRQKQGTVYGYDGIDDSFNITITTARAGLLAARALADSRAKKLLVIAAGIPELSPTEQDGNVKLGEAIVASADHAAVFGTIFAADIVKGIGKHSFYTTYPRLPDFLAVAHKRFPPEEWVVLFESPLPDLYY